MKLHIWVSDEPLSDDADGSTKIYVDLEFVIGNDLHEARALVVALAGEAHRLLLPNALPPSMKPSPSGPEETR